MGQRTQVLEARLPQTPDEDARRPQALDAGLFLVVVALPLVLTPFSWSPFADPKLVVLTLGTLLVFLGGQRLERRLAITAGAWFAASALSAAAGVDPLRSLSGLDEFLSGLGLLGPCVLLLVAGASLPPQRLERVRGWLVWAGLVMALVLIVWRLPRVAESLSDALPNIQFGSTVGNAVFAGAVMAAALAALLGSLRTSAVDARTILLLITLSAGISLSGERSALLLPAVAATVTLAWSRVPVRRALVAAGIVAAVLAGRLVLQSVSPDSLPAASGALSRATDAHRFTVWGVDGRAFLERPVLGWGFANSLTAYRATATPEEIRTAGLDWFDAHNLPLETATSSGLVGLVALLVLTALVAGRAIRADSSLGWAAGAGATLVAFAMYEPYSVAVSPLLFLLVGAAASTATRRHLAAATDGSNATTLGRATAIATGVGLGAAVALAVVILVSSSFQRYGERYEDQVALARAIDLQPWRLSARAALIEDLALDGRAGSIAATTEARALVAETVRAHPWDPMVRLDGASAEILLKDLPAARAWVREQLERFPGDAGVLPSVEEASGSATRFARP